MIAGPRLRQVAVVAANLDDTARQLRETFGWTQPFRDPGVGQFGLANSVFAAGDTFVEIVTPVRAGTTAGRYLETRGGDSGYMALFQVPDLKEARDRAVSAGVRIVWSADLPDIAGRHLHPKDVPGAIVSLDWAEPPESWHWAGPDWTGHAPPHPPGGLSGLTIEVAHPVRVAARWAEVLGLAVTSDGGAPVVRMKEAGQQIRFLPVAPGRGEGITEVRLTTEREVPPARIAGVRFVSKALAPGGEAA
ncbi:MAG TPA: hypothetical protein VMA95_12050 [Streptosporangiaceae bacterium]|nr:hypothetical protein [Streptosporangiaceae bacterium]